MGYSTERFRSEPNDDLICTICRDVLEAPVQRVDCEHYFCKQCITTWLERQQVCPIDRQPLTPNDLQEVPRIVKSLINNLDIGCDFASEGCQEILKLDRLEGHSKECLFNPQALVECSERCGAFYPRIESEAHSCLSFLKEEKEKTEKENKQLKRKNKMLLGEKLDLHKKVARLNRVKVALIGENRNLNHVNDEVVASKAQMKSLTKVIETQQTVIQRLGEEIHKVAGPSRVSNREETGPLPQDTVSNGHLNLIAKLEEEGALRCFPKLGQAMASIDLSPLFPSSHFDKLLQYGRRSALLFQQLCPHIKDGDNVLFVLNSRRAESVYHFSLFARLAGPMGRVVVVTNPFDFNNYPNYKRMFETKSVVIVVGDPGEGHLSGGPYDIVFADEKISDRKIPLLIDQVKVKGVLVLLTNIWFRLCIYEKEATGTLKPLVSNYNIKLE